MIIRSLRKGILVVVDVEQRKRFLLQADSASADTYVQALASPPKPKRSRGPDLPQDQGERTGGDRSRWLTLLWREAKN